MRRAKWHRFYYLMNILVVLAHEELRWSSTSGPESIKPYQVRHLLVLIG